MDTDVQRLKRQREALGAVNRRAEADAKAADSYTHLGVYKRQGSARA